VAAAEAAEEARLARRALTSAGTDAGAVPPQARRRSIVACLSFRGPVPAALQAGISARLPPRRLVGPFLGRAAGRSGLLKIWMVFQLADLFYPLFFVAARCLGLLHEFCFTNSIIK